MDTFGILCTCTAPYFDGKIRVKVDVNPTKELI
jgi:hypothetical protein